MTEVIERVSFLGWNDWRQHVSILGETLRLKLWVGPLDPSRMSSWLSNARSWRPIREELKRCFSDQTSLGHAATQLENMTQKPNEPLRLYIFRYSKIHKSITKRDACYDTDPSR